MKNSLKIAAVFIGTFVGAGFASGREVMQYFVIYGKPGVWGAVASSIVFGLFCYITLNNLLIMGASGYLKETNRHALLKLVYYAYMAVIFCTMVTASGEMLKQAVGLPKIWGVAGMLVLSAFVMCFGCEGVVRLNTLVAPVIIIGILVVCIVNILTNTVTTMSGAEVAGASLIYVSYNTITLASVAAGMGSLVRDKKTVLYSSLWSGLAILVLVVGMFYVLYGMPTASEMPVLEALSDKFVWIYVPVLACAMITTAVANGYGIAGNGQGRIGRIIWLCAGAAMFSTFKFSFVVKYFYGFFGLVGIYVMLDNLMIYIKNKKIEEKRNK